MKATLALLLLLGAAGCSIESSSAPIPALSITPVAPDAGPPQRPRPPDAGQPRPRPDAGLPPDAGHPVPRPRREGSLPTDRLLVSQL